jgi:uncharacterized protein YciI
MQTVFGSIVFDSIVFRFAARWLRRAGFLGIAALVAAGCATAPSGGPAAPGAAPGTGDITVPSRDEMWFVFLESGKPTSGDVAAMQRGHIANFQRLFAEQRLFAAGPLKDPSEAKRGIVIVKARTYSLLESYFQPDQYVREGFLKLNAAPALVNKGLATEGLDSTVVEEVRIVQVMRNGAALPSADAAAQRAALQRLVEQGTFGAWYTLEAGPVAEVLFSRNKDERALQQALAALPAVKGGAQVAVWGQWFSKGVLR